MNEKTGATDNQLRERAEKAISEGLHNDRQSFSQIKDYVHELQVYQAELEMQADELRRTQAELETSRDEFSELYDQAPIGYLSINYSGIIIKANETSADMLRAPRDGMLRKPLSNYISPQDHALFFAVCKKALHSDQFRTCELCFKRTDEKEFFGRLDVVPVSSNQFLEPHYRVTLVDVTERKKAEQENLRLEREILKHQKTESLKRLAGGIAHNFNNILTAVIGNIEIMKESPLDAKLQESCLDHLYRSSLKAADLSTLMLHYLGEIVLKPVILDLVETLTSLQSVISPTISGPIQLVYKPAPGPIYIKADKTQLAQILNNLISNAVEAIGNNAGTIKINAYQDFFNSKNLPPSPHGEQLKAGEYACLEIRDTGRGMDSYTLQHAIDPFFTTNFTGRGLGLSAVWGTVHAYHGYLYIQSEKHQGTTVQVYLPIVEATARVRKSPPKDSILKALRGQKVLYVDDDPIVRTIGRVLLKEIGAETIEAEDGIKGVETFRRKIKDIACIILDYAMPGQDGNITLNQMRKANPRIPVLLVSGYLKEQTSELFRTEKPDAYLQKPFTKETFKSALNEMLIASKLRKT